MGEGDQIVALDAGSEECNLQFFFLVDTVTIWYDIGVQEK